MELLNVGGEVAAQIDECYGRQHVVLTNWCRVSLDRCTCCEVRTASAALL
jgi:hypothetical protein